jgi:glycerol-3-phosphate dehydrogenase
MRKFSKELYPTVRDDTFFQSCGVADLIATCYGGRNRLVAMEYARAAQARPAMAGAGAGLVEVVPPPTCNKRPLDQLSISKVKRRDR